MLRVVNSLHQITLASRNSLPGLNLQTLRCLRTGKPKKPRWLPIAKTKRFIVPQQPSIPKDEFEELKRLRYHYRTSITSIRKYLENKYSIANTEKFDHETHELAVKEDFIRCNIINEEWNAQLKVLREQRVAKELEEEIQQALNNVQAFEEAERLQIQEAEEIVLQQIECSKDFISRENLDAAIEKALENPTDYNYAIDLEGNKIYGRETKPPPKEEEKRELRVKQ